MKQEPRCCKNSATRKVTYDCGKNQEDQVLILCDHHFNLHEAFQRNIKKIEKIN